MDLTAILPLLLSKNKGDLPSSDLISLLSKKDKSSDELIDNLIQKSGAPKQMASVLSALNNSKQKKPERFDPILGFVNDDILGKMTRYFYS